MDKKELYQYVGSMQQMAYIRKVHVKKEEAPDFGCLM